jgi:hypothetical protein
VVFGQSFEHTNRCVTADAIVYGRRKNGGNAKALGDAVSYKNDCPIRYVGVHSLMVFYHFFEMPSYLRINMSDKTDPISDASDEVSFYQHEKQEEMYENDIPNQEPLSHLGYLDSRRMIAIFPQRASARPLEPFVRFRSFIFSYSSLLSS